MSTQENHDVFSEETETPADASTKEEGSDNAEQEAKAEGEAQSGVEGSEQQGDEGAEPPAADGDNKVSEKDKMIPEHRFKAALKNVNDELAAARQELAAMKAAPPPDRAADPEGYDRHVRIETSKKIMTRLVTDYDAKIERFQEMAKANPMLNKIVGDAEAPAQMAYDLATRDMEIEELTKLKDDPELKEFKEWKAAKAKADKADTATQLQETKKPENVASKVPNLNRNMPSANRAKASASKEDDELFAGHHSVRA